MLVRIWASWLLVDVVKLSFTFKKILLCCFVWVKSKKQKTEGERGELETYIAFCLNRDRAIVVKW